MSSAATAHARADTCQVWNLDEYCLQITGEGREVKEIRIVSDTDTSRSVRILSKLDGGLGRPYYPYLTYESKWLPARSSIQYCRGVDLRGLDYSPCTNWPKNGMVQVEYLKGGFWYRDNTAEILK